jgi:hypothetical protein
MKNSMLPFLFLKKLLRRQEWWCVPKEAATQKAEARGSFTIRLVNVVRPHLKKEKWKEVL